jgi:sterol desaturase/sphingolipid hydroxylase (fatty acid hydroxylase superfamily)
MLYSALNFLPWPLSSLSRIALAPPLSASALPPSTRYAEGPVMEAPFDHFMLVLSAAWKLPFALLAYYYCGAPSQAAAAALAPAWCAAVVARDVLVTWAVGALWDFLHLSPLSPLYRQLQPYKFKAEPPPPGQVPHDFLWATCSALVSSAWEIGLLHLWGTGRLALAAFPSDAWYADPTTWLLLLALPYIQIVHFYCMHRLMHKWGVSPDIGAWLYRHVHALHHQSRDPTAFSGISMHPVESALFFTTMLLAALAGAHPIVILHCKFYNIVVAMLGHESFGAPSTGGHGHWLHHQLVEVNYGGNFVPLDWLFGTYVRDEGEWEARQLARQKKRL